MIADVMETEKPKARKGRVYLPPNLYSGAFLLSLQLMKHKSEFIPTEATSSERIKVYCNGGKFYTVPRADHPPASGYNWQLLGRLRGRDMYVANRTILQ